MPPHAGYEQRIAGHELRHTRGGQRLAKARITFEIRVREVDETDRLPSRCRFQRSGIQVEDLLRRKQREPAPADRATDDVIRRIVVARSNGAIADPDADQRIEQLWGKN